ncbi:GFA family protein [Fulvimarina sp. 2208YS6-2-32]|uniref:GFA family protein n=1 Tax=Fulvimarina uroteuthidis TaxID=3098149 RepID=A0ABU5I8B2_9HYPH|nr:GFA family protein [Fulvimarina sp. 2208YS6-2-32]MDY8110481.1 GFA family protein [Fulvimarina sp. 2208YS6-2-32]
MTATGGCQCGAVRFVCKPDLSSAHICHCRMCQKAVGNLFAALVGIEPDSLVWTKAEPKRFRSSNHASRGFCPECGTPLLYEAPDGQCLTIGAFDRPQDLRPLRQHGIEADLGFMDDPGGMEATTTIEDGDVQAFLNDIVSYQHPDEPGADEDGRRLRGSHERS